MARRIKLRHVEKHIEAARLLNPSPTHDPVKKKAIYPLYTREALMSCEDNSLLQSIADFYDVKVSFAGLTDLEKKKQYVQYLIEAQVRYRVGYNPATHGR